MKRLAQPRTAGALLLLVVAVCVLLTSVSNAAGLSLLAQSGGVFAQTTERCTDADLEVTPSGTPNAAGEYNRVTVSGDFGSCTDGNISLYLKNNPFTVLFSAPITVSGSSVEVETSSFEAPESDDGKVVLGLNGWLIPAGWSFTPPAPANSCAVYKTVNGNPALQPNRPCTFVGVQMADFWETQDGGRGNLSVNFTAPGIAVDEYVQFSVVVPSDVLPGWWSWSGKVAQAYNLHSAGGYLSRCAELPVIRGRFSPNMGETLNGYFEFFPGTGSSSNSQRCNP